MTLYDQLKPFADSTLAACHFSFDDGSDGWKPLADYGGTTCYAYDTMFAMLCYPGAFTDAQVKNILQKFAATWTGSYFQRLVDNTGAGAGGIPAGNVAEVGDSLWMMSLLGLDYYQRSGDLSVFTVNSANVKTAMLAYPRSGAGMVQRDNLTDTARVIPSGFQDGFVYGTDDVQGTVFYFVAAKALATLYTAAGDAANAALFAGQAATIAANFAGVFYCTADISPYKGLFCLGSAYNALFSAPPGTYDVGDIFSSAFAVYAGLSTPEQTASVGNYLAANYATLVDPHGYVAQSPVPWPGEPDGHYTSGYWTICVHWIAYALLQVGRADLVTRLLTSYLTNGTAGVEWWGRDGTGSLFSQDLAVCEVLAAAALLEPAPPTDKTLPPLLRRPWRHPRPTRWWPGAAR